MSNKLLHGGIYPLLINKNVPRETFEGTNNQSFKERSMFHMEH